MSGKNPIAFPMQNGEHTLFAMVTSSQTPSLATPNRALMFTRNFFRRPAMIGAIVPSSRYLVRMVMGEIDWANARVIVEFGPGVGAFTKEILSLMRPDAVLIAFETHPEFVDGLRTDLSDPRLQVVHGSAEQITSVLSQLGVKADFIVSGIPFSTMPEETRGAILVATHQSLTARGRFVTYQYRRSLLPHLRRVFRVIRCRFEPLNVPPAQVFVCRR
jgi:phospholipid N-methyltransferase